MIVAWLLLTFSKIVIINGANLEESMMEEKHLQSRYQSKRMSDLRDLMWLYFRLQAIDVLKLAQ